MKRVFFLLALWCFIGCTSDVAGGGPSGTEAGNAITASVTMKDNSVAALARVYVKSASSLVSTEREFQTDSMGQLRVTNLEDGAYVVEIATKDEGLQFKVNLSNGESYEKGELRLSSYAKLRGNVDVSEGNGVVYSQGTRYKAAVDANGNFYFDALPAGPHTLIYTKEQNIYASYVQVYEENQEYAPPFVIETERLLLDDFEDMNTEHRFSPYLGGETAWWFLSTHDSVKTTFNSLFHGDTVSPLEGDGVNQYIHFSTRFPENLEDDYPWGLFGMQIGDSGKTYDLTGLDSIVFKAKGVGTIYLQLLPVNENCAEVSKAEAITLECRLGLKSPEFRIDLLGDEWMRVSVPVQKLEGVKENPILLTERRIIAWAFDEDVDFYLDDVELVGLTKEQLWF